MQTDGLAKSESSSMRHSGNLPLTTGVIFVHVIWQVAYHDLVFTKLSRSQWCNKYDLCYWFSTRSRLV